MNREVPVKGFLAGCMIGLGGLVFLAVPSRELGSFLFSFGLLTVIAKQYLLYTGLIGYYRFTIPDTLRCIGILIFNIIGAFLMGKLALGLGFDASRIVASKLQEGVPALFARAVICGILMYLGVSLTKETRNPLYAIFAVVIFILTGSEHCIANAFFFASAPFEPRHLLFFLINILGNSVGSIIWYRLQEFSNSK